MTEQTEQAPPTIPVLLIDPEGNQVAEATMNVPEGIALLYLDGPLELPVDHEDAALIRAADSGSSMDGRRKAGEVMTRALLAFFQR
jgi:hypothetical protein